MSARGQWMFDPDSGGQKIPETVKRDIEKRIHAVAIEQFSGQYNRLDIRFRCQFCYIGRKPEKNISKGCEILLFICAVCGISVMTGGVLPFTPTATRSTSYPCIRMVSSSELRKKRSSHLHWST